MSFDISILPPHHRALKEDPPVFVAWAHFACTPMRYQDLFIGEDADPLSH